MNPIIKDSEGITFTWQGMELECFCDPDDGRLESVTYEDNKEFLQMLSDYYSEMLQDDFTKFMENNKENEELEKRHSNLSTDELTERKQGLGIS